MKTLLYVLALLTWLSSMIAPGVPQIQAGSMNFAATLWAATLIALGAAAICDRLDTVSAQLKAAAKVATPKPPA